MSDSEREQMIATARLLVGVRIRVHRDCRRFRAGDLGERAMKGVHMAKVKKKVRKLVREKAWAVKVRDDEFYDVMYNGLLGSVVARALKGRRVPVEIRELPAKKAGGRKRK